MRGKVCVVTGATSGIGQEAALLLAGMGASVVLAGRNAARGEAILAKIKAQSAPAGDAAVFLAADFAVQASVRQLAREVQARYPRIDVLIHNAGAVFPQRRLTADGIEETLAVNHLAPFLLTQLLRERLTANGDGLPARVVTVSSEAHQMLKRLDFDNLQGEKRYRPISAYAISKLANVLFTYELARQAQSSHQAMTANCMHPGVVRTNIWQASRGVLRLIVALAKPFMLSAKRAAGPLARLASDPALEKVSGRYFIKDKEARSSELSYDQETAKRLWKETEALIR